MTKKLLLGTLLLGSLLGGCRSERVAFRFSPARPMPAIIATPAPLDNAIAEAAAPVATPELATSPARGRSNGRLPKRLAVAAARALRQKPLKLSRVAARLQQGSRRPAAAVADPPGASRLERDSLFLGLLSGALGLLLVLVVNGRSFEAATLLLNTAHILFGLAGLALLVWFVLLVMRASKES